MRIVKIRRLLTPDIECTLYMVNLVIVDRTPEISADMWKIFLFILILIYKNVRVLRVQIFLTIIIILMVHI